jgi:hypothetical protein
MTATDSSTRCAKNPGFTNVDTDLKLNKPELR